MILRVTALLVYVLAVGLMLTASRTVPQVQAAPIVAEHTHCNQVKKRAYIGHKREATWEWQDLMLVPHTRTSLREQDAIGCAYLNWLKRLWSGRADEAFRSYVDLREPKNAICHVFGEYCSEALSVSWCESRYHVTAENGQYLGLFQMGAYARSLYGHSSTALGQAHSALLYFVASGRDWSPWSCRP